MTYRRDIDGLRCLAVVPVLLYHVGTRLTSGGFVGVDVFFVISGYLITGILYREVRERRFSVARFYERRIRRIFPALFAVIAATLAVGVCVLLPRQLSDLAESIIATALFASNQFFSAHQGYFDSTATTQPLLHTWSLAVEEQFYLLFPVCLAFVHRRLQSRFLACTWIVGVTSFALSVWLVQTNPAVAFYFAPARAWELMLGALIALGAFPAARPKALREALGLLGLAMVLYAVVGYRASTPFPGVAALLPTVGAALVIYTALEQPTFVSRLLGLQPLVFVGLISYSLYLWHWPVIVYTEYLFGHVPSAAGKLAMIATSFALAVLSWRFVERPFRRRGTFLTFPRLVGASGAAMACCCLAGVVIWRAGGLPSRFSPPVLQLASYMDYDSAAIYRQGTCFLVDTPIQSFDRRTCLGRDATKRNYLLVGDSHAAHLWAGLSSVFPSIHFEQATAVGCKPFTGPGGTTCQDLMNDVLGSAVWRTPPDAVLISADWSVEDIQPLLREVAALRRLGRPIIVFGVVPDYGESLSELLALSLQRGNPELVGAGLLPQSHHVDDSFAAALHAAGVRYVSLYRLMCERACMTLTPDGVPIQWDTGHFTLQGARYIAAQLALRRALLVASR